MTTTRHDQHGRYPQAATLQDFQRHLATVQARIAAACQRAGRDPASVRLLPVSKTQPEAHVRLAHAAGCRLLGDYEPARAGDMAYIGAIAGRWRKVKPRMGIIGATMDELSDGARVLALARPDGCTASIAENGD